MKLMMLHEILRFLSVFDTFRNWKKASSAYNISR